MAGGAQAGGTQHEKHRQRMHRRVEKTGFEGFSEHEVLEYILYFAVPRRDTNPIAHALIERFGGFAQVLEANEEELLEVPGIGPTSARLIHSLLGIGQYYAQCKTSNIRFLRTEPEKEAYFSALFYGQSSESFWLIALDDRLRILRRVKISEGVANAVSTSVTRIAAEAVSASATGVVLAHNHPTGFAAPSAGDIAATAQIMQALRPLNIFVLDHYIVTPDGVCSMKQRGNLPRYNPATGEVCYIHE